MVSNSQGSATRVHVPLERIALCLDCEGCFEYGHGRCPACGSSTWMPIARFLEASRRTAVAV